MSTNQQTTQHDGYLSALAGLPHVDIYIPTEDGHDLKLFQRVEMRPVLERLLVLDTRLRHDIDVVNVEIGHWGRMAALARRAWTVRERQYRVWKAHKELAIRQDAKDRDEKITEATIEARYRTAPDYAAVSACVEEAQETAGAVEAIHEAFRAKADLLRAEVRTVRDGTLQRMSP